MTTLTHKEVREQMERAKQQLRALVAEGRGEEAIELALAMLEQLQDRNTRLVLELAKERRDRAGRKSEKIDPAQLMLMLELMVSEAVDTNTDLAATAAEDEALDRERHAIEATTPAPIRRRPVRRRPPAQLPRDVIRHELPEAERLCITCGVPKDKIGEDVSELLELVPAHFRVQEHHRVKYACGRCKDGVLTAPGPAKLIDKGLAGAGLLAHVAVSKYEDHIPLHRLSEMYERGGVELASSTLCGWVAAVADEVQPVVERIWEKALASHTLQTDASGLKVLDRDDPEGIRSGTMWCFVGDEKYVVFKYAPTGSGEDGPWKYLAGREGYVQADAASVFDRLYNGAKASATEVGCWSHGRRKFEALQDSDVRVAYPLKLISQLYRLEDLADRRGLDAEARLELRRERASPILERLERWLKSTVANEPPASALAKACAYCVNQWVALNEFCYDGLLKLDNNCCERQIRSLAVGRKNYLFAGSDAGAERAAILYSLLRTAALAGIDTYAYLIKLLQRLAAGWPQRRIDELLPENHVPAVQATETTVAEPQPVS
jgi:transposase